MIPINLRIVLIIGVISYFVIILMFLKKKALALKYTLLWLVAGVILGIMVAWPETLTRFIRLLGITGNMNGLFILCIAFLIMIMMSITSIVSKQTEKIKNLTQTISKMEKVSLILTTYNCKENLQKTLKSIENQDYPNIEVVIKDGKSKDGTIDVIQEYEKKSRNFVVWESKKDSGIYDAMNQGYDLSTGDIIVFFNDVFVDVSAVRKMVEFIQENVCVGAHADLVYADGEKIIRKWHMGEGNIRKGWMPGHPTLFLKREIYEKYGLYDTSFKIAADYEFMIRFLKDEENELVYLPETIISMFYGGTSSGGLKSYLISLKEGHRALKTNGIRMASIIDIRRTIRVLLQFAAK